MNAPSCPDPSLLLDLVHGAPPTTAARLRAHATRCEVCTGRLAALREEERVLRDALRAPVPAPGGLAERVIAALDERHATRTPGRTRRRALAAAALLAAGAWLAAGRGEPAVEVLVRRAQASEVQALGLVATERGGSQ